MGPLEAVKPWSMEGVNGVRGFLDRVWRMITAERSETLELNAAIVDTPPTPEQNRVLHRTIQGVTQDIERMFFNTAISKMMEFTNFFLKEEHRPRAAMEIVGAATVSLRAAHGRRAVATARARKDARLRAVAHVRRSGHQGRHDRSAGASQRQATRPRRVPAEADAAATEAAARADEKIAEQLAGKTVVKVIAVPGRLVNFVVK